MLHMNAHIINLFIFIKYTSLPGLWLECRDNQQDRLSRAGRGKICRSRSLGVLGIHMRIKPEALQTESDLCNEQESVMRGHVKEA